MNQLGMTLSKYDDSEEVKNRESEASVCFRWKALESSRESKLPAPTATPAHYL